MCISIHSSINARGRCTNQIEKECDIKKEIIKEINKEKKTHKRCPVCANWFKYTFHSDRRDKERIKLIHSWGRDREITELRLSNKKKQCVHMKARACVWGSTKPEKEKREMPSEPGVWEARRHVILEEMHWQQRGTRCNTLMNKYGESWNWSLVLSGGGKKKARMNRGYAIWWVLSKHGKILKRRFLLSAMTLG